jgi:hypothetical protein
MDRKNSRGGRVGCRKEEPCQARQVRNTTELLWWWPGCRPAVAKKEGNRSRKKRILNGMLCVQHSLHRQQQPKQHQVSNVLLLVSYSSRLDLKVATCGSRRCLYRSTSGRWKYTFGQCQFESLTVQASIRSRIRQGSVVHDRYLVVIQAARRTESASGIRIDVFIGRGRNGSSVTLAVVFHNVLCGCTEMLLARSGH